MTKYEQYSISMSECADCTAVAQKHFESDEYKNTGNLSRDTAEILAEEVYDMYKHTDEWTKEQIIEAYVDQIGGLFEDFDTEKDYEDYYEKKKAKKIPAFVWKPWHNCDDEVEVKTLDEALADAELHPSTWTIYITDGFLDLCTNDDEHEQPYMPDECENVNQYWKYNADSQHWEETDVPPICTECNEFMEVRMVDTDGTNLEEMWVCPECKAQLSEYRGILTTTIADN